MANYYKYSATMGDRTYFTSVVTNKQGKDKRYFSNIESEIYFGDQEMTDLYQFEFGIDEKVLPVYGYNCYYASELVSGQRIIQGQFVVNYTDSMLIQSVLSSIDDSIYREITSPDYLPGGDLHHAIYDKQFDIMIGYGYYNVKDLQTYNATCQTIIGAKITGMHKVMDTTGQPILEVFTFMAKDFIEEHITEATPGAPSSPKGEEGVNDIPVYDKFLSSDSTRPDELRQHEEQLKDNKDSYHFVHRLDYDRASKTVNFTVRESAGAPLTLVRIDSLEFIQQSPLVYSATAGSGTSVSITLRDQNLINKLDTAISGDKKSFLCDLTYIVKVGDQEFTINHDHTNLNVK